MNFLNLSCWLLVLLTLNIACNSNISSPTPDEHTLGKIELINVNAFNEAVTNKKVQLLDVRSNMEYKKGHLKDAQLCDFNGDDFIGKIQALNFDKEQPVYVYCHAGGRSADAAKILKDLGFKHIFDMDNGYSEWSNNNLPSSLD